MDKVRAGSDTPNLDPTYAISVVDALTEPLDDLDDLDEHPF